MKSQAKLPPWISVKEVSRRLSLIFPEGTPHRNYVVRELCAKTIFVMLYTGAIEGKGRYLRPDQVVRMSDRQSKLKDDGSRLQWAANSLKPRTQAAKGRWYAANTREPIRDETLRQGLITLNAVFERRDLPTTSSKPRYALCSRFASLFNPEMDKEELDQQIQEWRQQHLSAAALARTELVRRAATAFLDRENSSFRKCVSTLAWRSFAWFAAEPDKLIALHDGSRCAALLSDYLAEGQ